MRVRVRSEGLRYRPEADSEAFLRDRARYVDQAAAGVPGLGSARTALGLILAAVPTLEKGEKYNEDLLSLRVSPH